MVLGSLVGLLVLEQTGALGALQAAVICGIWLACYACAVQAISFAVRNHHKESKRQDQARLCLNRLFLKDRAFQFHNISLVKDFEFFQHLN